MYKSKIQMIDRVPDGYGGWIYGVGSVIIFEVLGQVFREIIFINNGTKGSNEKELTRLLAIKVQEIGKMIERQVDFGKKTNTVINGVNHQTFGWDD